MCTLQAHVSGVFFLFVFHVPVLLNNIAGRQSTCSVAKESCTPCYVAFKGLHQGPFVAGSGNLGRQILPTLLTVLFSDFVLSLVPSQACEFLLVLDKTIKLWKISERDKRAEGYNLKDEDGRLRDPFRITALRVCFCFLTLSIFLHVHLYLCTT